MRPAPPLIYRLPEQYFTRILAAAAAARERPGPRFIDLGRGNPDLPLEQHPMVQHAQAALDRAELNLSYAEIHAPENGIVTKVEQLQVGDYVNAGTPLESIDSPKDILSPGVLLSLALLAVAPLGLRQLLRWKDEG